MEEDGKPLHEATLVYLRAHLGCHLMFEFVAVVEHLARRQQVRRGGIEDAAEAVSSHAQVVESQSAVIFVALDVEATVALVYLFAPSV